MHLSICEIPIYLIYDRDSACTLYNGMPCVCLVLPAPKMRRSLNTEQPFSGATLYFRRTQRGSIDSGHFIYKGL